jgi:hypothetical protein
MSIAGTRIVGGQRWNGPPLRRLKGCLLAIVWVIAFPAGNNAGESATLKERFLNDAPREWEAYHAYIAPVEGVVTSTVSESGKMTTDNRLEFKANPRCRSCLIQPALLDYPRGELRAYNPRYAFTLTRRNQESAWAIKSLDQLQGDTLPDAIAKAMDFTQPRVLIRAFSEDLLELVHQPTFRLVGITPVQLDDQELARVEFENPHPPVVQDGSFFPIQSGILILDPSRSWAARSYELKSKYVDGDAIIKGENEFVEGDEQKPLPKHHRATRDMKEGRTVYEMVFDLRLSPRETPDDQFTLATFGLPEPSALRPSGLPWFLWMGAAGTLLLVFGGTMLWLRNRNASRRVR